MDSPTCKEEAEKASLTASDLAVGRWLIITFRLKPATELPYRARAFCAAVRWSTPSRTGILGPVTGADFMAWFRGDTRRQRQKDRRTPKHPIRSAIAAGGIWGVLMWLLLVRSVDVKRLVVLALASAVYGSFVSWERWTDRRETKGQDQTDSGTKDA